MAIHNDDVEREAPLRHLYQGAFGAHLRFCLTNTLARLISFRMSVVKATLVGFPAWMSPLIKNTNIRQRQTAYY
jgi:hypothetical protein